MSPAEPAALALGIDEARRRVEGLRIEVPGSSANLGPGFDALAVAVRLYLRVTVRRVLDGPRNELRCSFAGVALEGDNYIARSVDALATREGFDYPALDVTVESEIPMQGGLGSSAAATVAGLCSSNGSPARAIATCWPRARGSKAIPTTWPRRCWAV